ncbi:hypothetical protein [Bradyrhizobium sp. CCGUVB23]|uniref:hypothetical protein n=1 Tax=Bradyrhizobium sp. CCGUVB23 TaxID=2949630 RepID=UPI0020B19C78|nr:hypothetical protein [Bradyrhizobium sp. CCGUVB23]MCP3468383.1 hypothetical protein [Bradyrhizobium sp. CCGUVB23]
MNLRDNPSRVCRVIRVFHRDHFATLRPAQLVVVHGRSFEWLDIRTETVAQLRDPVTLERAWVPLAAITVPTRPKWSPTHPAVTEAHRPAFYRRFIHRRKSTSRAEADDAEEC